MVKTDNTTHHLTPISVFPCSVAHILAPPVPKYRTRTLDKFYPGFQSHSAPDAPIYFWHRSFVNRKVFHEYKLYYLFTYRYLTLQGKKHTHHQNKTEKLVPAFFS